MRISVALCTFNGQRYLARQLRSLADQIRPPDELIICDDGSTDQTCQIIRRFAETAPFDVRLEIQPVRLGVAANFSSAIAASDGNLIACCDQDDVWYPEKLSAMQMAFEKSSLDLIFHDGDVVDDQLRPLGHTLWQSCGFTPRVRHDAHRRGLLSVLTRFNVVTGTTMMFAARFREVILPIPNGWIHDGWIALMLAACGRCDWIDVPLMAYRQHDRQQIGASRNTLQRQINTARAMDAAYFARQAENYQQALDRLLTCGKPVSERILNQLRRKIAHCHARVRMRTSRPAKPALIARELITGRYRSAAMGWKSVAQDVFLGRHGRKTDIGA
jgi:glycosyltransferase involved in cell wall biosynthesis